IGDGPKWKLIESTIKEKQLKNVTLLPWQPEAVLPYSVATADVGLVSIEDDVAGLMLPSKAFTQLAAGRPLIVLCGQKNAISGIVSRFKCGVTITPKDVDRLCSTISNLVSAPAVLEELKSQSETAVRKVAT